MILVLKIFVVSQERTVFVNPCFVVRTNWETVGCLQQSGGGGSGIDSVNPVGYGGSVGFDKC